MTPEQRQLLERLGKEAVISLALRLIERGEDLIQLAITRASSEEAAAYGDSSYRKPVGALQVDVDEELADAIFYEHLVQSMGVRPPL